MTRKEKEEIVIKLANQGQSTREIAKVAHVSLRDIGTILRRYVGEEETATADSQGKSLSLNSKAFKLFRENKDLVDVAIALDMDADEVLDLHDDYLRLSNMHRLMSLYREMGDDIEHLVYLYNQLECYGLANRKDISYILQQEEKLKNLDKELYETAGEVGRLNSVKTQFEEEIKERMKILDQCDAVVMEKN